MCFTFDEDGNMSPPSKFLVRETQAQYKYARSSNDSYYSDTADINQILDSQEFVGFLKTSNCQITNILYLLTKI